MRGHLKICSAFAIGTALWLTTPLSANAEKVWDNDLKRFLTQAELNHAEVFMSEEEAVKIMLPESKRIRKEFKLKSQQWLHREWLS